MTPGLTSTGNVVAETPKYLFDRISSIFNFSLDVCALPENAKCENYYTPKDDGLSKPWGETVLKVKTRIKYTLCILYYSLLVHYIKRIFVYAI